MTDKPSENRTSTTAPEQRMLPSSLGENVRAPTPSGEEPDSQRYMELTPTGMKAYRDVQASSLKKFFLWSGVGFIGGIIAGSSLGSLNLKNKSNRKLRNYRMGSFLFLFGSFSYHGYKLSMRDFKVGRQKLLKDPINYKSIV